MLSSSEKWLEEALGMLDVDSLLSKSRGQDQFWMLKIMGYLVGPLRHSGLYCCHLMLCNGQTVGKCAAFASAHGTRGGEVSLSILIQMNMSAFSMAHVFGI